MKIACYFLRLALISQAFAAPHIHALIIDGQNNLNWKSTASAPEDLAGHRTLPGRCAHDAPQKRRFQDWITPNSPNTRW
jgi:hypothetical protein